MKEFNFNTIQDFDSHIQKSIPNYDVLNNMILSMSEYFITKSANIYDLGCSTGRLLKELRCDNPKIGYDNSKLLPSDEDNIKFKSIDLNEAFEVSNACLVYSIFTMQFLQRDKRKQFVNTAYKGLNEGSAFILCEKIYQDKGILQEVMSFSHYDYKLSHFSADEIIHKERDLRFIMKPNTLTENYQLLESAGFSDITSFWQSYNFIGLIAIK